jgi:bacterioferritin
MGSRGRQIVGMDVDQLLKMLNAAYASEWLAYYQYWLGARLIKGPMKDAVAAELTLQATEELNHAVLLANRITTYQSLMDATKDKDMVTCNLALTILEQEVEHEEDLQRLREDLDLRLDRGRRQRRRRRGPPANYELSATGVASRQG